MLSSKIKKLLKEKNNQLVINLENNYKDLAWEALRDYRSCVDMLKESGELKGKDFDKQDRIVKDYEKKMEGYHH